MLTRSLTALVLAATPQVPTPTCKLAGPAVEAHWSGAIPPASRAEAPLRVVADVPLPGSASRFDYQSLEPTSGRLFISHMGAGQLVVFDVRDRKSTRLNSSHLVISYAVFCLKKKTRIRSARMITRESMRAGGSFN